MGVFSGIYDRQNCKDRFEKGMIPESVFRSYFFDDNFSRLERAEKLAKDKEVSVATIALSYVLNYYDHYNLKTFALVGAENKSQVESNAAAASLELTKKELDWLYSGN
jgi:aryl-alcohol dehydrogenase-like predicted oxidoreductase